MMLQMPTSRTIAELREAARAARARQRFEDALEAYLELERREPEEPAWPKSAAECHERLGQHEPQLAALERAASRYAARGFFVRAIAMCKMILAREPEHLVALEALMAHQARRVTGLDRLRRKRPSSPPSTQPLESASLHDVVDGSAHPVDISDAGVYDIPLERAPRPSPVGGAELDALAAAPLFATLSADALRRLVGEVQLLELPAEAPLYAAGEPPDALYFIADGGVRLHGGGPVHATIAELGPGDVVGVVGLVANEPRPTSAVATEPGRFLALHRRSIDSLLREVPGFREGLFDLARQRLLAALFATHPLFRGLAPEAHDRLLAAFRLFEVRSGATLVETGATSQHLIVIMTGRYEARGSGGTAVLRVGDVVGASAFVDATSARTSLVAVSAGFVLALHRSAYLEIVGEVHAGGDVVPEVIGTVVS